MRFEDWWKNESGWGGEHLAEYHLARDAWNAAIDTAAVAVESADHNDDDSGHAANCNAMINVERLKAK